MDTYTIDAGGPWRRFHPMEVPKGWRMLGTIQREGGRLLGALGRSPDGIYFQVNAGNLRLLDQQAVVDALRRVKLP